MAAVALILAAALGAFIFEFGEKTDETTPVTQIDVEREVIKSNVNGNERVSIIHSGGDAILVSELSIITEAKCYDDTLLTLDTKRGQLVNLPVDPPPGPGAGIENAENVEGDEIFETAPQAAKAPLSGGDTRLTAGDRLSFQIDDDNCGLENSSKVTVGVIHEPTNSRILEETLGAGFQPAALEDNINTSTAGATSKHTWNLADVKYGTSGNNGDEVDEITVDYDPNNNNVNADFNGIDDGDVTVTMTRTLSGGPDRSKISVNSDTYSGSEATFDLSGFFQTDVAGPITIEIDGIVNPGSAGSYPVEITLDGDAGTKTVTKTLDIEN